MDCSICTEILSIRVTQLVCGHRFHTSCLDTWLQMGARCPNCRGPTTLHLSEVFRSIAVQAAAKGLVWQEEWAANAAKRTHQEYLATCLNADLSDAFQPLQEPNVSVLREPLSCIYEGEKDKSCWTDIFRCSNLTTDYRVSAFCEGLLAEEPFEVGNFPNNIAEYYWIHAGKHDEEAWYLLCQIRTPTGPAYAFYVAECSYTGFEYGGMRMWVSKNPKRLFYEGLTKHLRKLCLKEKRLGKQGSRHNPTLEKVKKLYQSPPPETSGCNSVNPTKAYVRLYHNDIELSEEELNIVEITAVENALSGLTATFLDPKPARPPIGWKPRRKFFVVKKTTITGIDEVFKRRFGNPDKRWVLRVKQGPTCRQWGKVEVQFTLF